MQKISILLSFVSLWLTSFLSHKMQIIMGFALIFSFGIIHGANDLEIIKRLKTGIKNNIVQIIFPYLLGILASFLLFYLVPKFALVLFIVVSAYHFGEQHWNKLLIVDDQRLVQLFEFSYGLLVFSLIFFFNKADVIKIVYDITNFKINNSIISYNLTAVTTFLIFLSLVLLKKSAAFRKIFVEQLFYILVLVIIFKTANLIWGFTIYFVFWHSIPSLNAQIEFLYGEYSFKNFKIYFGNAFVNWIISLVSIVLFYFFAKDLMIFDALVFSFLGSITFPHALTMLKMFKSTKL